MAQPLASHLLFNGERMSQQIARRSINFQQHYAIHKPRLIGDLYRFGFIKG